MKNCPKHNMYLIIGQLMPIGIVVIMLALTFGCSADFGHLRRDAEIQLAFESNQVPSDYKYFHYSESEPYVILGLDRRYDIKSIMWREVSSDTAEFKKMVRSIWEDYGYEKFGADILDPDGKKVGIMYTAIRETSVKFVGENEIVVMPHTPYLWGGTGGGRRSR